MNAKKIDRALAVLGLALSFAGCHGLLDVRQPGLITDDQLTGNPSLQASLVVAAEGDYHRAFNWMANSGAALSDEGIFGHSWSPWEEYDNRSVTPAGGAWDGMGYAYMQAAKTSAARAVDKLGADAAADLRTRALIWDGFSSILLADYMCSIPLNGKAPSTRDAVYDTAIGLLKQAAAVSGASADQVALANVGIARAYLNKGDFADAASFAAEVPQDFEAWIQFIDADFGQWADKYNLYARTSGLKDPNEFNMGLDPSSDWGAGKRDLRVPFETDSTRLMFTSHSEPRRAYLPFTPYSFQNWTPGNRRVIQGGDGIRFASGLEAQYIVAEASLNGASGMPPGDVLAFINARRAVGGLPPFGGTDVKAELREQRMMDFYWAGYRVPDLLRYQKLYDLDLWPTGKMGGFPPGAPYQYGTTTCLPIGQSEVATNPNVP